MSEAWLPLLLALVALLYASVGHGGASGYLAVMALMGTASDVMRPTALVLNLLVSAIAFAQFARSGYFRWRLFWPFAMASVPLAWVGAQVDLDPLWYRRVLGACLLVAVARLLGWFGSGKAERSLPPVPMAMAIGAMLGLLSGMIGIGGGILLSPLLLVFGWSTAKESAAVSAAFIFVNSMAGLLGMGDPVLMGPEHFAWIMAAFLGGMLGAYIGARRFQEVRLKQVLGVILLMACVKLFWA